MGHLFNQVKGAYSVVGLLLEKGLICFRDPHGIRPLVFGTRTTKTGQQDIIFASETTPFYTLGFQYQGDVLPGEVVFVSKTGQLFRRVVKPAEFRPCIFEYVYFARPDATLNDISVYSARLRLGQKLAQRWKQYHPELIPDIVISAPYTANTAAQAFAHELGVRYTEGLYKNPFIGRTFIMPNENSRKRNIRFKLTPQRIEIENKTVLIVDDSIVRGTTSREIVKMIRDFGAKKIYFVSTCPAIKNPCFYGIDIPSRQELIAAQLSETEIAQALGVDELMYQTQTDLIEAVKGKDNTQIKQFCTSCMDGQYFCPSINPTKMQQLEQLRKQQTTCMVE